MMGEVANRGYCLSELLGVICISLFLMNLLPVPVLDGGTVLFACGTCDAQTASAAHHVPYQFIGIRVYCLCSFSPSWRHTLSDTIGGLPVRKITCPCEQVFNADIPEKVDLDQDTDALDKLMDGSLLSCIAPPATRNLIWICR